MTSLWYLQWDRELTGEERHTLLEGLPASRRSRLAASGQDQVLCAYGLLGLALRRTLGWEAIPPIALESRGKPYFSERPEVHFSLSHTAGAGLVGLSLAPIGVDIEKMRPLGRVKRLLGEALTEEEALQRWTALEAAAKRSGRGVGEFLRDIPDMSGCACLEVGTGYFASAACKGEWSFHRCRLEDLFRQEKSAP